MKNKAKSSILNVAYLDNEILRPWTVNLETEQRLRFEISALENTISITSPQKYAGKRGESVLDDKFPELVSFEKTLHMRAKANPYKTKYDPPQLLYPYSKKIGDSRRSSQGKNSSGIVRSSSNKAPGSRLSANSILSTPQHTEQPEHQEESSNHLPQINSEQEASDADIQHITNMQRKIYVDSRHSRNLHSKRLPALIPPVVRYRPTSQPALLTMKMHTYMKTKQMMQKDTMMRSSVSHLSLYK